LLSKKQGKNAPSSGYTLLLKAYSLAYRPAMPYSIHPYSIQAKRGYKSKSGNFSFAELTAVYAEHKEHIKAIEAAWYERIKQMDAEKSAEKDKLYREMNDHARENSRLEVI